MCPLRAVCFDQPSVWRPQQTEMCTLGSSGNNWRLALPGSIGSMPALLSLSGYPRGVSRGLTGDTSLDLFKVLSGVVLEISVGCPCCLSTAARSSLNSWRNNCHARTLTMYMIRLFWAVLPQGVMMPHLGLAIYRSYSIFKM